MLTTGDARAAVPPRRGPTVRSLGRPSVADHARDLSDPCAAHSLTTRPGGTISINDVYTSSRSGQRHQAAAGYGGR